MRQLAQRLARCATQLRAVLGDEQAQVACCGAALAGLERGANNVADARAAVAHDPDVAGALDALLAHPHLVRALDDLLADLDPTDLHDDPRGEGWLFFYEDFLAAYDPSARRSAGVWYTPVSVVNALVSLVDHVLPTGLDGPDVRTLDPAMGTGAFPLALLERGVHPDHIAGLELLPGPLAVARLRLTRRMRTLHPDARALDLRRADALETRAGPVNVVLGNPPYQRVARGEDGWLWPLFDELLDVARAHTIFSHHASLYNQVVYFWRWAIHTAFEAHGPGPAVVAFVTASSWLTGPGFVGLRQLARDVSDEILVVDLGGDNKGANPEHNLFDVETPVAIVVLARLRDGSGVPRVRYHRVTGTRADKEAALAVVAQHPAAIPWQRVEGTGLDPLVPATGGADWLRYPALADLFPWQQPGCKVGRTWPISPCPSVLADRWRALMAADPDQRPSLFRTARHGRTIHTRVGDRPPLVDEPPDAPVPPIVPYAYRSFDRQWILEDPRLAALERPSLWRSRSVHQVFLTTFFTKELGPGAAMHASTAVPDLDAFCGRGGKDVVPLYREGSVPNVTAGLLDVLGTTPEALAAYVYALMSAPAYRERFAEALATPGPRVPLTADPGLWREAVTVGEALMGLHTGGVAARPAVQWTRPVRTAPVTLAQVRWRAGTLHVGDGVIQGVRNEVWDYRVSGMKVVRRWLGYRTVRGSGRAASSGTALDHLRPGRWLPAWSTELAALLDVLSATCDVHPRQAELLERICTGPLVDASALPTPNSADRRAP